MDTDQEKRSDFAAIVSGTPNPTSAHEAARFIATVSLSLGALMLSLFGIIERMVTFQKLAVVNEFALLALLRARGIENQDFIREDKNPNRCWVDLASFRRNYPEIAEATDVAATVLANLREEPPLENWDGTTIGAVLRATTIALSAPLALVLAWLWRKRQVPQKNLGGRWH